jgi:hypothetical protein
MLVSELNWLNSDGIKKDSFIKIRSQGMRIVEWVGVGLRKRLKAERKLQ